MTFIHKIKISITDTQVITLPRLFRHIDIQVQDGGIVMWYAWEELFQNTGKKDVITLHIFGTGDPIEALVNMEHMKTVQLNGFVWHIYKKLP